MKHKILNNSKLELISFVLIIFFFGACKKSSSDTLLGNWVKQSDFEGVPRTDAVAFTIGTNAYLGTGYDGTNRLSDFWQYDPDRNFWQQKASLRVPGAADTLVRNGAVGFGTDTKGYIGTGYNGSKKLTDFWEYDPTNNTWTKKADFAGGARYGAVSFSIANIGYIGTGYNDNTLKDFWQYNPTNNSWTQIVSIAGSKRRDAAAFVVNGIAYVGTGVDNGVYVSDFWAYDPTSANWTRKRDIANTSDESYDDNYKIVGINGAGFSIGSKGYIATASQSTVSQDVWEYNPSTDLWTKKHAFEGSARTEAVGFTVNNRGFVATGRNSSYYFDDIWEFRPDDEYNKND